MIELNTKNRVHIDAQNYDQYYAYNYNDVSDNVWKKIRNNVTDILTLDVKCDIANKIRNNSWYTVRTNVLNYVWQDLHNHIKQNDKTKHK